MVIKQYAYAIGGAIGLYVGFDYGSEFAQYALALPRLVDAVTHFAATHPLAAKTLATVVGGSVGGKIGRTIGFCLDAVVLKHVSTNDIS